MTTIRTYGNLAEAGFAKSLLDAAGIPAELADEHSYALGYGPGIGGLRLQVAEADLERAHHVLAEGPDAEIPMPSETIRSPLILEPLAPTPRIPYGVFVAGGLVFAALVFVATQLREEQRGSNTAGYVEAIDANNDGIKDTFYTFADGLISTAIVDRNRDEKPDVWQEYDARGLARAMSEDNNFDSNVDVWYTFRDGELTLSQVDADFNGVADYFISYADGMIATMSIKPNGSTKVTRQRTFTKGILSEEVVDANHDGQPDYRIKYDAFESPSERLPIESPK